MGRPSKDRTRFLRIEQLETREYLSVTPYDSPASNFDPSAEEMELLALINQMRSDPQGELDRIFSSITDTNMTAKDARLNAILHSAAIKYPTSGAQLKAEWEKLESAPPLAWNPILAQLAKEHTESMIDIKQQYHDSEETLKENLYYAGYWDSLSGDSLYAGENVTAAGLETPASGYGTVASYIHQYLVLDINVKNNDPVHRSNVMDPNYKEIGIGLALTSEQNFGPWVATMDFASAGSSYIDGGGYLLGMVYDDLNSDKMYQAGEGLEGMSVVVMQSETVVFETTTFVAGAFQTYLDDGTYSVTVSGPGFSQPITKSVTIDGKNASLDFLAQETVNQKPVIDLNGSEEGSNDTAEYTENSGLVLAVSDQLTITDSNDEMLNSAKIVLTNRPDGYYEVLSVAVSGTALSSSYNTETGELIISGSAPVKDYVKVLKTLSYTNTSDRCSLDDRLIEITVSDSIDDSDTVISTIKMNPAQPVSIAVEDVKIIEGDTDDNKEMTFEIVFSDTPRKDVIINFVVQSGGTAVEGVNYEIVTQGPITVGKDQTSAKIVVRIIGDYECDSELIDAKTFVLEISTDAPANLVTLDDQTVSGTILEDDYIQEIGDLEPITTCEMTDIEFKDGRRNLYQFTPLYSGRISWDAYRDQLPSGVKMTLYLGSHNGTPLASSAIYMNRQHLEYEFEAGKVYTIKIDSGAGDEVKEMPNLDRLKMTQIYKEVEDWLEVEGDPTRTNEYTMDMENGRLGVNDTWGDYEFSDTSKIRFVGQKPDYVRVIPRNDGDETSIDIIPDGTNITIGGVTVDVSGFQLVKFYGTDGHSNLSFTGTDGDDQFFFKTQVREEDGLDEGFAQLVTSDGVVYEMYDVKTVVVDGKGGNDTAEIYDTSKDDTFVMRSNVLLMQGNGFHTEVRNFNMAFGANLRGGKNTTRVYGEENSTIILDYMSAQRIGNQQTYRVWNSEHVIAQNADATQNIVIMNGSSGNDVYTGDGSYMTITNTAGTFLHEVIGFYDMLILPFSQSTRVSLDELPEGATDDEDAKGMRTISSSACQLVLPAQVSLSYRVAVAAASPAADSVESFQASESFAASLHEFDETLFTFLAYELTYMESLKNNQTQQDNWMEEFERLALLELMS